MDLVRLFVFSAFDFLHKPFDKSKVLYYYLPAACLMVGLLICIAWFNMWGTILSLGENYVTMKFSTSLGFFLLGSAGLMRCFERGKIAMFLAGGVFFSCIWTITSWVVGAPNFYLPSFEQVAIKSISQDFPSWGTIACFMLASIGMLSNNHKIFSRAILAISIIPFLGYVFDNDLLQYNIENYSTAMAIHTSILFLHFAYWLERLK